MFSLSLQQTSLAFEGAQQSREEHSEYSDKGSIVLYTSREC